MASVCHRRNGQKFGGGPAKVSTQNLGVNVRQEVLLTEIREVKDITDRLIQLLLTSTSTCLAGTWA